MCDEQHRLRHDFDPLSELAQASLVFRSAFFFFCFFFFFSSSHLFSPSFLFRPLLQFSVRIMSLHTLLSYSESAINETKGFQFRHLCYTEITEPARLLIMLFFPLSIHLASTCQMFLDPFRTSIADACLTTLS